MSKIKLSIFKEDATDKFLENLQSIYSLGSQIDIEERKKSFYWNKSRRQKILRRNIKYRIGYKYEIYK